MGCYSECVSQREVWDRLKYSEIQRIAYHEAAHAVGFIHAEVPFSAVYLAQDDGTITLSSGIQKSDAAGTVEMDPLWKCRWMGNEDYLPLVTAILAGFVSAKIMYPHLSYLALYLTQDCTADWEAAREYLDVWLQLKEVREAHQDGQHEYTAEKPSRGSIEKMLDRAIPQVRKFVTQHWDSVTRIGDALLASPTRSLSYAQVVALAA